MKRKGPPLAGLFVYASVSASEDRVTAATPPAALTIPDSRFPAPITPAHSPAPASA
ncbi:hypothetical protein [Lysobacter gummosus]|uniref:hypothetical protein n=1 Tax=Lysobacter gummosus TaxID=262324 RepID=UPI0036257B48